MNRRNGILLKIILSLFALNSLSLFLYFTSYSSSTKPSLHRSLLPNHRTQTQFLKPWPILPSYLPWTQASANSVDFRSCEAYFGNGFTHRLNLLSSNSSGGGGGGWFRCWYSDTLRSSICEGGKIRMVPEKIQMSIGGENLKEVLGRKEEDELPVFLNGAFEVHGGEELSKEKQLVSREFLDDYVPRGEIQRHTMRDLISSIRVVGEKDFACDEWIEEPTLLVTRFEYANMFHTVTDWYSAYASLSPLPVFLLVRLTTHQKQGRKEQGRKTRPVFHSGK